MIYARPPETMDELRFHAIVYRFKLIKACNGQEFYGGLRRIDEVWHLKVYSNRELSRLYPDQAYSHRSLRNLWQMAKSEGWRVCSEPIQG